MIGIVPSITKTYEVEGYIGECSTPIEGKLYIDKLDKRLYLYSSKRIRPNPESGYFPIWDGKELHDSSFANKKYLKDVTLLDLNLLSNTLSSELANEVIDNRRRSEDTDILQPQISEGDNAFTQCVKGAILAKQVTLTDLSIASNKKITDRMLRNYYNSLQRISFMRTDKWSIWIDIILKLQYLIKVYNENKLILSYKYPEDIFKSGIVNYESSCNKNDDPLKKILKILMLKENITKSTLKTSEADDYTINNLLAALSSNKSISAQLFSRFMKMARLNYEIILYDKNKAIFKYREEYKEGSL